MYDLELGTRFVQIPQCTKSFIQPRSRISIHCDEHLKLYMTSYRAWHAVAEAGAVQIWQFCQTDVMTPPLAHRPCERRPLALVQCQEATVFTQHELIYISHRRAAFANNLASRRHRVVCLPSPSCNSSTSSNQTMASTKAKGIVVFSGGSAANNLVDVFSAVREGKKCQLSYVIPISDNGGSSSELIRVFGGPGGPNQDVHVRIHS